MIISTTGAKQLHQLQTANSGGISGKSFISILLIGICLISVSLHWLYQEDCSIRLQLTVISLPKAQNDVLEYLVCSTTQ